MHQAGKCRGRRNHDRLVRCPVDKRRPDRRIRTTAPSAIPGVARMNERDGPFRGCRMSDSNSMQTHFSHVGHYVPRKTGKMTAKKGKSPSKEYLYSFDRMDFQQMGKQDNAGRFECGDLKATTENLTSRTLSRCEKPPRTN